MSEYYANKETRDRLGEKSRRVFGSRGKWKKLIYKTDNTVKSMEQQMDLIIEEQNKRIQAIKEAYELSRKENDNGGVQASNGEDSTAESGENGEGIAGSESGSGQTGDESSTSGGAQ